MVYVVDNGHAVHSFTYSFNVYIIINIIIHVFSSKRIVVCKLCQEILVHVMHMKLY